MRACWRMPRDIGNLVERLIYLTITRPDLVYVVHIISQFMQTPRVEHMEVARKVLRYLKGSLGYGILFGRIVTFDYMASVT